FIYVFDVCQVLMHVLGNLNRVESGLYNLGTGHASSWLDLGRAVFEALDQEAKITFVDMPATLRNQYQYFTEARMDRLREALKYDREMTDLRTGARDYVSNYLSRPDSYR